LNVQRTVRGYEAAGGAAIQIEDQETPKNAAYAGPAASCRREMVLKIRVAAEARRHPETMIVARHRRRTAHGPRRGAAPRQALRRGGPDVIFVNRPKARPSSSASAGK